MMNKHPGPAVVTIEVIKKSPIAAALWLYGSNASGLYGPRIQDTHMHTHRYKIQHIVCMTELKEIGYLLIDSCVSRRCRLWRI